MSRHPTILSAALAVAVASSASSASIAEESAVPETMLGVWNVSQDACAGGITPDWLEVTPGHLGFFYGHADIVGVERTGDVVFLRGDLRQEGQREPEAASTFYRLDQRNGANRLRFKVRDGDPVDLVRCDSGIASALPLRPGVYVVEGSACSSPANAEFRVFDGTDLSGSAMRDCTPQAVSFAAGTYTITQSCVYSYTSRRSDFTETLTIPSADRFVSDDGQAFRLCPGDALPDSLQDAASDGSAENR